MQIDIHDLEVIKMRDKFNKEFPNYFKWIENIDQRRNKIGISRVDFWVEGSCPLCHNFKKPKYLNLEFDKTVGDGLFAWNRKLDKIACGLGCRDCHAPMARIFVEKDYLATVSYRPPKEMGLIVSTVDFWNNNGFDERFEIKRNYPRY